MGIADFGMSWLRDFRAFAGETSAHGVKNIFEGPNKLMKLLFLIVWLSASIYTCYIIVTSVVTFINKPTGTKYEVIVSQDGSDIANSPRPQTIKFPTISVCSHNKVKKSYLELPENDKVKKVWEIIDQYDIKKTGDLDWEGELASLMNMTYEDVIDAGGPDANRLLSCVQRNKNCNSEELLGKDYMVMENTITGKCWRINPEGMLFGKGGDWGKLQLMFWADLKDYGLRTADTPAYGFTVAFHDHETYGSTISSGYFMSPGSMYKVDVALKREKREPPPGGNCDISKTNTSYGAFDEGSCVLECKDKYLYEQCQCVNVRPPLKHPDVQNYRSCTLKEWADCGLKAYTDWTSRYMDPNFTEDNCYCPSACKETRYEAQLSSSSISPAYATKLLQAKPVQGYLKFVASNPAMNISYSTAEDILENMMVVELLFTSMSVSEIRQVVTYTFYNMLGDIGGVLGLFLGASLFTILEFFQFLLFAVGKHCLGWKTGDDHEKLQDQEMPAMKEDQNNEYKS